MHPLTRRDALGAAALGLAGLAGCLGSGGDGTGGTGGTSDDPRLDRVGVANAREDSVSLDLQFELDGEVVFWQDVEVAGVDDGDGSVQGPTFVPPAFPRERGEWRVRARVRDGGEMYTTLFTSDTTAESCLALGVNVQPNDVEVTYVATHDCEDAESTETTTRE
jgi:hypothetical protein